MSILQEIKFNFPLLWNEKEIGNIKVRRGNFRVLVTKPFTYTMLGFDPGEVNMGAAVIAKNGEGEFWQVRFPSNQSSVQRIFNTATLMNTFLMSLGERSIGASAVVENASFGSPYGQAALSENRTMIAHEVIEMGMDIAFVPPLSIRKTVFGSAKIKAEATWPELEYKGHNDIASALACALYGYVKGL